MRDIVKGTVTHRWPDSYPLAHINTALKSTPHKLAGGPANVEVIWSPNGAEIFATAPGRQPYSASIKLCKCRTEDVLCTTWHEDRIMTLVRAVHKSYNVELADPDKPA